MLGLRQRPFAGPGQHLLAGSVVLRLLLLGWRSVDPASSIGVLVPPNQ